VQMLSEFSHPNSYALINHFEWKADLRNMPKVTFGKPARTQLVLCLPAANFAVVAFPHSMADLIMVHRRRRNLRNNKQGDSRSDRKSQPCRPRSDLILYMVGNLYVESL